MKSPLIKAISLDIVALCAGVTLWYWRFALSFVGASWEAWALVGLQVLIAFLMGVASVRWLVHESSWHRGFRLILLELGHIYMWIWAAANYVYTGKVEFSIGYFLFPALVDVLAWWWGIRWQRVKRRS